MSSRRFIQYPAFSQPVYVPPAAPSIPDDVACWASAGLDYSPALPRIPQHFDADFSAVLDSVVNPFVPMDWFVEFELPKRRQHYNPENMGGTTQPIGINLDHGDWSVFPVRYGTWGRVTTVLKEIVCG